MPYAAASQQPPTANPWQRRRWGILLFIRTAAFPKGKQNGEKKSVSNSSLC